MRRGRFLCAVIAVLAFTAMTIESASAHDKGCDGNSVPGRIKLDCCGEADEITAATSSSTCGRWIAAISRASTASLHRWTLDLAPEHLRQRETAHDQINHRVVCLQAANRLSDRRGSVGEVRSAGRLQGEDAEAAVLDLVRVRRAAWGRGQTDTGQ
jgi:hypothetical protein